jgi:translation initiation factor IF-2
MIASKKTAKATPKVTEEPKSQNRVIVAGGKKVVSETETGNRPIVVGGKKSCQMKKCQVAALSQ